MFRSRRLCKFLPNLVGIRIHNLLLTAIASTPPTQTVCDRVDVATTTVYTQQAEQTKYEVDYLTYVSLGVVPFHPLINEPNRT